MPDTMPAEVAVTESVRAVVLARLGVSDLSSDARLADYGLDSLDIIVMVGELEDEFGFVFPEEAIFREEVWTIRQLGCLIAGSLARDNSQDQPGG